MKSKKGFIIFYIIFVAVLAAVLVAGTFELYNFLIYYEESVPARTAERLVEEIKADCGAFVTENADIKPNDFESSEMLKKTIAEKYAGAEISYQRNTAKSTTSSPVFDITADGYAIATIRLKNEKLPESLYDVWQPEEITCESPLEEVTYVITVPYNAVLYVNGVQADKKYISESTEPYKELDDVFFSGVKPYDSVYKITLLCGKPQLLCVDFAGNNCKQAEGGDYIFKSPSDENKRVELSEYIINVAKLNCEYATNDIPFNKLEPYIYKESPFYGRMKYAATMFYATHTGYEFANEQTSNMIFYDAENFSCDVKMDWYVFRGGTKYYYPISYRYFFTLSDGKWLQSDQIII